jgi:(2R)-ethylmalonyl-CoA mutase
MQQILAYETDLLEYDDLFAGSHVVAAKTAELAEAADAELQWVLDGGGAFSMIDAMKQRLVQSNAERVRRIEAGDITVVGVNRFTETADSPLVASAGGEASILVVDEAAEREQLEHLAAWRAARDDDAVAHALDTLRRVASGTDNLTPASTALARAGGTVGEWAGALRDVFGEYRAPTGVGGVHAPGTVMATRVSGVTGVQARPPVRILVGKPGLDGLHGAEQIAVRGARRMESSTRHRLTPAQIAAAARRGRRPVGLRLSGRTAARAGDGEAAPCAASLCRWWSAHHSRAPPELLAAGVARVYTPKDFRLGDIVSELADLVGTTAS